MWQALRWMRARAPQVSRGSALPSWSCTDQWRRHTLFDKSHKYIRKIVARAVKEEHQGGLGYVRGSWSRLGVSRHSFSKEVLFDLRFAGWVRDNWEQGRAVWPEGLSRKSVCNSSIRRYNNYLGAFLKCTFLHLTPRESDSVGSEVGPRNLYYPTGFGYRSSWEILR